MVTMAAAVSLQFPATPALPSIKWQLPSNSSTTFHSSIFHDHRYKIISASCKELSVQTFEPKHEYINNSGGNNVEALYKNQGEQSVNDTVLQSSSRVNKAIQIKGLHAQFIKIRSKEDIYVNNNFIHMYAKCGCLDDARQVFDKMSERNLVSWNTILAGCVRNGQNEEALDIFSRMHSTGVKPDEFTFGSVLKACSKLEIVERGKGIHAQVVKFGFEFNIFAASALVDMYVKCRSIHDANKLFEELPGRDLVLWTAMISAYAQDGQSIKALKLFCQMQWSGIKPNTFSFTSALVACCSLARLDQGTQFHALVVKYGLQSDTPVGNSLITMYSKCGSIKDAELVFRKLPKRSVISWSAMISGYAYHGRGKEALQLFEHMKKKGMKPNNVTFVGVLSACSHGGLVKEGLAYFDSMSRDYGNSPIAEHYACIVDLLGRAGLLEEAVDFIGRMPFAACDAVWRTLLGASRVHNNMEIGLLAAEHLMVLAPHDASAYVLLSNIYAAAGRWEDVARVRKKMDDMGVEKEAGLSWVEVRGKMHRFVARDRSHPQSEDIYATLQLLTKQIIEAGYKPYTKLVLHDVEDELKEQYLCHHSEKLAIAFGLLSFPLGKPIQIVKNLRVCVDCHTATKFISKIVRREIVMRDASRFHHFKDGICSCGDYW
ncbi:putative pentatricopeptide repeat-containing protein At1g68930 [Cryptomeria japonica]|uniref:putative pentatricopeptide repeat-containing protein At1g68930 n=1 Tax=Cryptomeria japonica TaxID=3369 RepID=UPI0025AC1C36|nr:putative pentatricopeptide repeat-containing protein At1g68930 [Cryptomeria japonica]